MVREAEFGLNFPQRGPLTVIAIFHAARAEIPIGFQAMLPARSGGALSPADIAWESVAGPPSRYGLPTLQTAQIPNQTP
jgi:hypothetical protein